jgi:hypothetical protein
MRKLISIILLTILACSCETPIITKEIYVYEVIEQYVGEGSTRFPAYSVYAKSDYRGKIIIYTTKHYHVGDTIPLVK